MPRSPTNKSSKKARGKASAARRRAPPGWDLTDPLYSGPGMRDPAYKHRFLIALLSLYASGQFNDGNWISLRDIMVEVDKHLNINTMSSRKNRLRHIRDALSSFEDKGYLEWDGLKNDDEVNEVIRLATTFQTILAEPLAIIRSQTSDVDFSTLTRTQHRSLGMWFRGRLPTNELGLRNLTKQDYRIRYYTLKKSVASANSGSPDQPHANSVGDADADSDNNTGLPSSSNTPPNQSAAAGPSQSTQTPKRSRTLNSAHAYPTPDSHPRGNQSGIYNNAVQAGPRIPALNLDLPTPAYTESEGDDFQDAPEMVGIETPLTSRELEYLQQIKDLSATIERLQKENERLEKENVVLKHSLQILQAQLEKERKYLCKKVQELRYLRAVEKAKWKFTSFLWRGRNSQIEQLRNEISVAGADITRLETESDNLEELVRQKDANIAALQQTVADQSEQLRIKEEKLQIARSFCNVFQIADQ